MPPSSEHAVGATIDSTLRYSVHRFKGMPVQSHSPILFPNRQCLSELISALSNYPDDARVTLLDPDKRWLLPIEVKTLPAAYSSCGVEFVAITSADDCDEIESIFRAGAKESLQD